MKINVIALLCVGLISCKKEENNPAFVPSSPTTTYTAYPQYGTPYSQVPDPKDVTIYEVNLRAFSAQGNFAGVQARLDSIQALGVNVIYLMPIYPVGVLKSVNSPYCVKDFLSVDSAYGTMDQLRTLVSEAHSRNMAVILDWVADQTSWDNAWINNKSWYLQDANGNIISPPNTNWTDVAALDYTNADMRQAMIQAMRFWVYEANIDGYRCDAADYIPFGFWQQAIDTLQAITSHKLLLLAEGTRADHYTAGFQLKYGMGFYYYMVNNVYGIDGPATSIDSVNTVENTNATPDDRVVRYISNHDVDNTDGTPLTLLGGKDGSIAAFVIAAYMNGVPMIYDGQEVSCPTMLNFFNNSTVIDWTINPDVTASYKKILGFRDSCDAIKDGTLATYSTPDICAFTKILNNDTVLVVVNCRNAVINYTVPGAFVNTNWNDAYDQSAYAVSSQISLQPFEYKVLIKQ